MNLNHINVIARYEVKLVKRSWLFRIFAILALLFISAIMLGYPCISGFQCKPVSSTGWIIFGRESPFLH